MGCVCERVKERDICIFHTHVPSPVGLIGWNNLTLNVNVMSAQRSSVVDDCKSAECMFYKPFQPQYSCGAKGQRGQSVADVCTLQLMHGNAVIVLIPTTCA